MSIKPWVECTPEHSQQLKQLIERFGIDLTYANNTGYRTPINRYKSYTITSYTLRDKFHNFTCFLYGNYYDPNQSRTVTDGLNEHYVLNLLASFSPELWTIIHNAFDLRDRGGRETHDPTSVSETTNYPKVSLIYIPKGVTNLNELPNKTLNTDLTSLFQREIISENMSDATVATTDHTLSLKVFTENTNEPAFIHVYINRKEPQTLRRAIYKTLHYYLNLKSVIDTIQDEDDKLVFTKIVDIFFNKQEDTYSKILKTIKNYIEKRIKHEEENLIKNFATKKQTALNSVRLQNLKTNYNSAKQNLEDNINRFTTLKNNFLQAKQALDDYSEVQFDAIEILLNNIKNNKNTHNFYRSGQHHLHFCIEEPLIHTESETWVKYISNLKSDLNLLVHGYAYDYHKDWHTTIDILKFAILRLIKELFIDHTVQLYTAAALGLDNNSTYFDIHKYALNTYELMPHPHIGTDSLTCWNEARREITDQILNNDGETAYLQLIFALQQMTASDSVVTKKLIKNILSPNYENTKCYLRKNKNERESFKEIIKEYVQNETDKINAIIASES